MFNDIAPSGNKRCSAAQPTSPELLGGTAYTAVARNVRHQSQRLSANVTRQSQRLPATSRANHSDCPQRHAPIAATARNVTRQSQRLPATSRANHSDCPQRHAPIHNDCPQRHAPIAATARKTSYPGSSRAGGTLFAHSYIAKQIYFVVSIYTRLSA